MKFDKEGREVPDPRPVAVPIGFRRPESLTNQIRRMVRNELSQVAAARGVESFREANDFELEDDAEDFLTPYEVQGMREEIPDEGALAGGNGDGGSVERGAGGKDDGAGAAPVQRQAVAGAGEDQRAAPDGAAPASPVGQRSGKPAAG